MPANTPRGREKHVTENGKDVKRRGEGLGTGPVGNRGQSGGARNNGSGQRSGGGGVNPLIMIIALVVMLLGGGGGALSMLGGDGDTTGSSSASSYSGQQTGQSNQTGQTSGAASSATGIVSSSQIQSLMNGQGSGSSWSSSEYTGNLDTEVASGSREKYTVIKGNGEDQTTIMVYICGTDLESRSGMASKDLQEMVKASFDSHINLIIYTGGCTGWKISGISTEKNQIYQIKDGNMIRLESNMGSKSMTDPATLTEFIKYCSKNYSANRYDLIFWDHGGGSITGYGYDQKYPNSGSMDLAEISTALKNAGIKYDFIGFDACLMATAENAQMLADYADYLIASEETEPGIGWYYTNWLTSYGKNPSMDTLSIGKMIADDFVSECAKQCPGQLTTLSVIDLAEFANTVPERLNAFAADTTQLISNQEYTLIATARQNTREFAQSSKIDQCDLIDLALRMDTEASRALAQALLSCVKYNRTSTNMTNAYGVSVYFPNRKAGNVEKAASINTKIGMDGAFSDCLRAYASVSTAGQTVAAGAGNTGSPLSSLLGGSYGSSNSGTASSDLTSQLLNALFTELAGASSSGRSISDEDIIDFVSENQFDSSLLTWQQGTDGSSYIELPEEQWTYVTALDQNMFYDDGEGFIDLGCDNLFTIDETGKLIADTDYTWLAIDGQPVAYYHLTTVDDGENYSITGYVPAMLNGERVVLYLVFDNENPYGFISGYSTDYHMGETETVAKADQELLEGDTLEFLCDYYNYEGEYEDSYYLGDPIIVSEDMEISNVAVNEEQAKITYKITDIYGQEYWTPVLP